MSNLHWIISALLLASPPNPGEPNPPALPSLPKPPEVPSPAVPSAPNAVVKKNEKVSVNETQKPAEPSKPDSGKPNPTPSTEPVKSPAPAKPSPSLKAAEAVRATEALVPGLSRQGLCENLKRTAREHAAALKKLEEEKRELAKERIRLEDLAESISRQRDLLRAETLRLEELMKNTHADSTERVAGNFPLHTTSNTPIPGLENLAKTVKAMKPEQAASLVERLDINLSAQLLRRMKPADAGAVMDRLRPSLAAQLLSDMAALPAEKRVK